MNANDVAQHTLAGSNFGAGEPMTRSKARSVAMVPTAAAAAAARYVEREYGCDGYRIGYAGSNQELADYPLQVRYVFQAQARDGSRFLVWSDRYENAGTFEPDAEQRIADAFGVEISAP